MQRPVAAVIVLAVPHAGAGAHKLDAAGSDDAAASGIVLMQQFPRKHVRYDLHILMRMRRKTGGRCDRIVVEHAKRAPVQVVGVEVFGEAERVVRLKPSMVEKRPVLGTLYGKDRGRQGSAH